MLQARIILLVAGMASACRTAVPAEPVPAVSLRLEKGSAERWEKDVLFRCEVDLDNALGHDLVVRSNFGPVFDGLELVVTTTDGKVIAQQAYTFHQAPFAPPGRTFALKQGKTAGTLVFPISDLPEDARSLKVRLVGTLPGSGHERILSSETL